ncbi:bacteriocin [Gallaecimonas sp. GXIMD1310]|uniref:bacteriocin n=1 Tax=Gallaecimonas sp. GXIMD1310 TaxID=3131926 RepID=UPI00324AB499
MKVLNTNELKCVVGGSDDGYDSGHKVGEAIGGLYDAAVEAVTDFFVWVDELDGSLAD